MDSAWIRSRLPALWALTGLGAVAAFFVLRAWSPGNDPALSICVLRRVFGLACPTCGLTRAFAELAKGHVAAAARFHPLAAALALEFGVAWLAAGAALARRGRPLPLRAAGVIVVVTLAALLAVWIQRLASGSLPP